MRRPLPLLALLLALAPAASAQVVIAEVYGGGGNTTAPFKQDYIVLYNNGTAPVNISGWSVQYAARAGTTWTKCNLTGSIAGKSFYYVQAMTGNGIGDVSFVPNVTCTAISMSARGGKVALSSGQVTYTVGAPTNPHSDAVAFPNLQDFIGYGGTGSFAPNQYEGAGASPDPNLTNSTRRKEVADPVAVKGGAGAAQRAMATYSFTDTNNNNSDAPNFLLGNPLPVELVNFTAQANGGQVRFAWQTASETNNAGFRLEGRSAGASDWTLFGSVASKAPGGTSTEAHSYDFVTDRLHSGRYEVRIVQTDLDGTVTIGAVDEVEIAVDGTHELAVLGSRAVRLAVAEPQQATIRLYDVTGREVANLFAGSVDSPVTVDLPSGLATGMYLVRVEGERFSATRNVVLR